MHCWSALSISRCCLSQVFLSRHTASLFFFFNDTATTEIYTLSLHDALPICVFQVGSVVGPAISGLLVAHIGFPLVYALDALRSEEHTSELQSQSNLVCRLLLEKKKMTHTCSACACRYPRQCVTSAYQSHCRL